MKVFIAILVIGAGIFYWQHQRATPTATAAEQKSSVVPATAAVTPRPVYEHDFAKHALDRTHEVLSQTGKTRKENEQP